LCKEENCKNIGCADSISSIRNNGLLLLLLLLLLLVAVGCR